MNQKPPLKIGNQHPFWQEVLVVVGVDTMIVVAGALVIRDFAQVSNFYFLSSLVLFIIAAIPIATEIGGSAKIAGHAVKKGEDVSTLLKDKQSIYERNARTTYIYGVAGIVTFALSFITTILI